MQGREQGAFVAAEKVEALDVAAFDGTGLGETVERPDASREVVQTGEVFEIAAIATEQDLTEVVEAVDGLSDGSEAAGCRGPLPMFHPGLRGGRLVWGFSCQVVIFWFAESSLFGAGRPFFVPSPAIRFPERAEGVKGPKR